MKIKFLKEYKFLRGFENDVKLTTTQIFKDAIIDTVEDEVPDEDVQWLIDNGFAEEVKESGWWKPKYGERYYYCGSDGCVYHNQWENDSFDKARLKFGLTFKTERATERYRDYQIAVATVRQDEGFMKISRKVDHTPYGYGICKSYWSESLVAERVDSVSYAGKFYFDTSKHAQASLDKHPNEWQTILDYDWSKGEDEEDED